MHLRNLHLTVLSKKKKKKYIYWVMWLESPKVDFALVMAGTQGLFHPLSLSISQFLFFLNQLHSEAPFHVFHVLRQMSIGSPKPALLSF